MGLGGGGVVGRMRRFNCGVSRSSGRRSGSEVVLFLLSVFLFGKVIAVAGVVGAVSISSIIGASRSY